MKVDCVDLCQDLTDVLNRTADDWESMCSLRMLSKFSRVGSYYRARVENRAWYYTGRMVQIEVEHSNLPKDECDDYAPSLISKLLFYIASCLEGIPNGSLIRIGRDLTISLTANADP